MKSAKERDELVARAQKALKSYPTFASLPETKEDGQAIAITDPTAPGLYVAGMYDAAATGKAIKGRNGNCIMVE